MQKTDTCWLWTAALHNGYGSFYLPGAGTRRAHRIAYEALVGPIPEGLTLDHLCRNRGCVNPAHLEPVTNKENILRGVGITAENARKTHCVNGHPLEGYNLMFQPGGRRCRECFRRIQKIRKRRARARAALGGSDG